MDMSLIYITAVIVVIAIGFVFALRMGIAASLAADREWPAISNETAHEAASEVTPEVTPEVTQAQQSAPSVVPSASSH